MIKVKTKNIKKYMRKWRANNTEKIKQYNHERYLKKLKSTEKKKRTDYVSNRSLGMGSAKGGNFRRGCIGLNDRLAEAIDCFELDIIYGLVRLLRDGQCRISPKSQQFLDSLRHDQQ